MERGKLFISKTNIPLTFKNGINTGFVIRKNDVVLSLDIVDLEYLVMQPILTKHGFGYVYSSAIHDHMLHINDDKT